MMILKNPAPRSSRSVRVLAVLLITIIPFGILELGLRLSGVARTYAERNYGVYGQENASDFKPWIGLMNSPNEHGIQRADDFSYAYTTNSLGFRDGEHTLAKKKDTVRAVVLGDSFTWGEGAPYEATYLRQLEDMLNRYHHEGLFGYPTEIMKCGTAGMDPVFSLEVFKRRLLAYAPDMVILTTNDTDFDDLVRRGGLDRFQQDGSLKPVDPSLLSNLFHYSHLARVLMTLAGYDSQGHSREERLVLYNKAQRDLEQVAVKFQAMAREHGFRFVVVLHPSCGHFLLSQEDLKRFDRARYLKSRVQGSILRVLRLLGIQYEKQTPTYLCGRLLGFFKGQGIEYIDLMPAFGDELVHGVRLDELFWMKQDLHCTPRGYKVFADVVAKYLVGRPPHPVSLVQP